MFNVALIEVPVIFSKTSQKHIPQNPTRQTKWQYGINIEGSSHILKNPRFYTGILLILFGFKLRLWANMFSGNFEETIVLEFSVVRKKETHEWDPEPCHLPILSSCLVPSVFIPLDCPVSSGLHLSLFALINIGPISEHTTLLHAKVFCFNIFWWCRVLRYELALCCQ